MRYLPSLLLLIIGCSDSSSIDPNDPLLGTWRGVDANGNTPVPSFPRWTFNVDGTYRLENVAGGSAGITEQGKWERIDAETISRCQYPCQQSVPSSVRIEDDAMLLDGRVAMNGNWSWSTSSTCTQHGGQIRISDTVNLRWDGAATRRVEFCNGNPGGPASSECIGAWTSIPHGISVAITQFSCSFVHDFFRVADMIADIGFVR